MKTLLTFASTLGLLITLAAHAQTPATPRATKVPTTKTPGQRAAAYQGPKVVSNTKELGTEMIQKSKPASSPLPPKAKSLK